MKNSMDSRQHASEDAKQRFPVRFRIALLLLIAVALLGWARYPWLEQEHVKHIETVSLCLEMLATLLGGLAFVDFLHTLKRLEDIMNSLSTKREQFPESLQRITDMLGGEGINEVRIMVDFLDYGRYANESWNLDYKKKLVSLVRSGADIRVLSYNRSCGKTELKKRFREFEGTEAHKTWTKELFLPEGNTIEVFIENLLVNERSWADGALKNGIHFRETNTPLPLFCWLVGKKGCVPNQAIVSFPLSQLHSAFLPGRRLRGEELSFTTSDPHFMRGFQDMFDGLYKTTADDEATPPLLDLS